MAEIQQPTFFKDRESQVSNVYYNARKLLERFLREFDYYEVRLTRAVLERLPAIMASYDLQAYDAVVVSSMKRVACGDLATFDKAFLRVPDMEVWNDGHD